jgi:nitrogen fixation/metabolism regulation signal transduction histidine kinase
LNASYRNRHKPHRYRLSSDVRLFLDALLVAVPTLLLLLWFWISSSEPLTSKLVISALALLWVVLLAERVRQHLTYHLRTASTLVEAIRLEDYSLRSSRYREPGALGELFQQVNALADCLQYAQQQEQELRGLLGKIIAQIQVAILAVDSEQHIQLVNPQAAKLAALPAAQLINRSITDTPFAELTFTAEPNLIEQEFPGASGHWQISWQEYRTGARPGKLLFITDLKQVLSEQEARAWQSLIRVITHEINNSLTPISSISQTLASRVALADVARGDEDFVKGLRLIGQRSQDLTRFIAEYARIARLPEPQKRPFDLASLLEKLQKLYAEKVVYRRDDESQTIVNADPTLIEQLLINLIKNGLEATGDGCQPVELKLRNLENRLTVQVLDSGQGLANPANLFVPFYTTKDKGSGIGLVLCRQIANAHGGRLRLENRKDSVGTIATLELA